MIVCYATFAYLGNERFFENHWAAHQDADSVKLRSIWYHRLSGVFWLGVVPALIAAFALEPSIADLGVTTLHWDRTALASAGFIVVLVPLIAWNARKPQTWLHYPQLRLVSWSSQDFGANALSWVLYLTAYEFFFRGFLLYTTAAWIGTWPAILLMTLIYFSVHLPKNPSEYLATIPMGIIFGVLSISTGGIWACVIGHSLIAISNDFFVIRSNPDLSWSTSSDS
jgi:membrane protease YdiL (CAAX protease family)